MVTVTDGDKAEARQKQSSADKYATFDALIGKELPEKEFSIELVPNEPVLMVFKAIDHKAYDKLVAKYPPNKEDEAKGATYDYKTFAPALVAAVSHKPELEHEQAIQIFDSPNYNRGDLMALFFNAVEVCNTGFDVPFSKRD